MATLNTLFGVESLVVIDKVDHRKLIIQPLRNKAMHVCVSLGSFSPSWGFPLLGPADTWAPLTRPPGDSWRGGAPLVWIISQGLLLLPTGGLVVSASHTVAITPDRCSTCLFSVVLSGSRAGEFETSHLNQMRWDLEILWLFSAGSDNPVVVIQISLFKMTRSWLSVIKVYVAPQLGLKNNGLHLFYLLYLIYKDLYFVLINVPDFFLKIKDPNQLNPILGMFLHV